MIVLPAFVLFLVSAYWLGRIHGAMSTCHTDRDAEDQAQEEAHRRGYEYVAGRPYQPDTELTEHRRLMYDSMYVEASFYDYHGPEPLTVDPTFRGSEAVVTAAYDIGTQR